MEFLIIGNLPLAILRVVHTLIHEIWSIAIQLLFVVLVCFTEIRIYYSISRNQKEEAECSFYQSQFSNIEL